MRKILSLINDISINYPIEKLDAPEKLLFLDIETTGFSASTSKLYLIGCAYYKDDIWHLIQWFAQDEKEEVSILNAFIEFSKGFQLLLHFNGDTFDIPFLLHKCEEHKLPHPLHSFHGIDLYKCISPLKHFLKLPNCKQKTLEQFLGTTREDIYNGGELISVYDDYLKNPDSPAEDVLLLHNAEDIKGMLSLLPMLAYYDLIHDRVTAKKVQATHFRDINGNRQQELLITLSFPQPIPKPVSASANGCYFTAEGVRGSLKIPIYEEEMKYFYSNYKDYYYLPTEDVALHKTVATFVDKEYRVQATAATCYTRKNSLYLPQWGDLRKPFFKRDYKSHECFFELTDELKQDRQAFTDYANHVLEMLVFHH